MLVMNHFAHCDTHWQDVDHFAGSNQCPVCGDDVDPHDSDVMLDDFDADDS